MVFHFLAPFKNRSRKSKKPTAQLPRTFNTIIIATPADAFPPLRHEDDYADTIASADADEEVNIVEDLMSTDSHEDEESLNVVTLRHTAGWSGPMPRAPTSPSFAASIKGSGLSVTLPWRLLNWLPFRKQLIDQDPLPIHGKYPAEIHPAPDGEDLFQQLFATVAHSIALIPLAVGSFLALVNCPRCYVDFIVKFTTLVHVPPAKEQSLKRKEGDPPLSNYTGPKGGELCPGCGRIKPDPVTSDGNRN